MKSKGGNWSRGVEEGGRSNRTRRIGEREGESIH